MGDEPNHPVKPDPSEQAIFAEALQRESPGARAAYLESACGADTALRRGVEALLWAAESAGDFLEIPPSLLSGDAVPTPLGSEPSERPGDRIGRYKLLEKIGEGGCGVVYMAEQEEPMRRRVALKVIKFGMDTRSVIGRFEAERQALALMDHPNIAKVFDGGATPTGRPYFVMELVRGMRITEFCDETRLSTEARLHLFVQVCRAVQHAHQKGIIHRDLKPSNILVTVNDGKPVPKVIDFGIAKATSQQLSNKTVFTLFHTFIGTPAYTSPEQAEMSSVDVDTRSDIYSLGVLLYELLTGKTPFDGEELIRSGLDEMRRIIREIEPPLPSTRLTQLVRADAGLLTAQSEVDRSASRRVLQEKKQLIPLVEGDLDWIVMKCLEKDRARRYETANGLAADIQRHLEHRPIEARPVSAFGRLWRWRRRHPAVAALSAGVLLLLLAVVAVSTLAAWRVASARRAEHSERKKAEAANQELLGTNERLADTVSLLELRHTDDLLRVNDASAGVAQLTAILRLNPSNHIAASRLVSALVHRNWALPVGPPIQHWDRVTMASFSPDGRHVLTASRDKTAQVQHVATRELLATVHHQGAILTAHYNPAGDRFVTASEDGAARVWNATNGIPITPELRHTGTVLWAEFSPDGRSVVTASADKTACIWDATSGALKQELRGHSCGLTVARFSPSGDFVATGTDCGRIRLWSADTGKVIFRITVHKERVNALAFSPDGSKLASGSADDTARIWNATNGAAIGTPLRHNQDVYHVAFSPNGGLLLTTSEDHSARLWAVTNAMPVGQPWFHGGGVRFGAFSPDGMRVVTTSMDNTARLWDVATGNPVCQPLQEFEAIMHAAFSPDGNRLVTAAWSRVARIWNIQSRRYLGLQIPAEKFVNFVAFDPHCESVMSVSFSDMGQVWNARTGEAVGQPMVHTNRVLFLNYSSDGRRIVTACADGSAYLWDSITGERVTGALRHAKAVRSAEFSPNGEWVVTASADGTARVWDARNGQPVSQPLDHGDEVNLARFSQDGRRVVTSSQNWSARVWDARTGQAITKSLLHTDAVQWAEFSPDGGHVVSASSDNTARVWEVSTGQPIGPSLQHARTVQHAVFSPDGRYVLTGSLDRTARIWDARTGEALTPPLTHDRGVGQVCFSPDGQRILTSSWSDTSRLWDAKTGRPLTEWLEGGVLGLTRCFDSTGQRMVTGGASGTIRVWDIPQVPTPVPFWFLDLAESVAGTRFSARGNPELISRGELEEKSQRLSGLHTGDFYERLGQWFLADPLHRSRSPF